MSSYSDIMSESEPSCSHGWRAAKIFLPFSALKGYDEEISKKNEETEQEGYMDLGREEFYDG